MRYIESYVHQHRIGVLVELQVKDQMTLRTREFKDLALDLAMHIAATSSEEPVTKRENVVPIRPSISTGEADPSQLLQQVWTKDPGKTIGELVADVSRTLGDPIRIIRIVRLGDDDN